MSETLIAHIAMAVSALLPAALLELMNHNKTKDFVGYNTPQGLKSQETRKFSVKYATKGLLWVGLGTVCIQAITYYFIGGETSILITALTLTVAFIVVIIATEVQLSNRFDNDGKHKTTVPKY